MPESAMAKIIISIAGKIVEYTVKPMGQQVFYLFSYNSNVANVEEQVGNLVNERSRVQHSVDEANRNGEEIEDDVKDWLRRVNEITTETEELFQPKVSCLDLWSRYQLSRKAKKMTTRIVDEIQKTAGKFDRVSYKPAPPGTSTMASTRDYESLESRISTLQEIMEALRNDNVNMIGVYGMAGVGKTTLVKEVGRQAQEDKLFDTVVMATVTQNHMLRSIQGEIGDMLGLKFEQESDKGRAGCLLQRIKKENKILVILDDLWDGLDLEAVGVPSANVHKGCKILLTSRSQDVLSNKMGSLLNFSLDTLPTKEAWQLFKKMAGDCVENPDLKSTAVEVSEKCSGLPIAIVTVARALRDKCPREWKSALCQLQRPNVRDLSGMQAVIYSTIELSYNCLESEELKSIFLLCGVMKGGSVMDLLKYSMGLGLLQEIYTIEEAQDRVYTLAQQLKASCLLLNNVSSVSFMMHDVVCDVAISIASRDQQVFTLKCTEDKKLPEKDLLKNCTKISLCCGNIDELPERLECPNLEFFYMHAKHSSIKVSDSFFVGMRGLKVIDFTSMLFSSLPSSLPLLTSLQTLCLDHCKFGGDLDLIGELKNLKILSLQGSDIKHLPRVIGQLTHLRLLDLSGCSKLEVIPPNVISNLKKLEELYLGNEFNEWEVEGVNNASLSELRHLPKLTALDIRVRDATVMPKDFYFEKLKRYRISIGDDWKWPDNEETSRILKLKLNTDYHAQHGVKMLLNNVENLYLDEEGVNSILYELNLEGFSQMKHLHVQKNSEIQHIINSMDWRVNNHCSAFVVLESLSLFQLSNLENICHGPLTRTSFCKLRSIKVKDCHKLKNLFSASVAKGLLELQEISIDNCKIIEEIVAEQREQDANNSEVIQNIEFRQLRTLKLCHLPRLNGFYSRVKSSSLSQGRENQLIADTRSKEIISEDELGTPIYLFNKKVALHKLENMEIFDVDNLRMICHDQLVPNDFFGKLKVLTVKSCGSLKSLFLAPVVKHLIQLEKLEISDCKTLEYIVIKDGELETEPNKFVFPRLTSLELINLPELKSFYPATHTLEWPFLKLLHIFKCNKVTIFASDSTISVQKTTIQPLFWIEKDTFANLEHLDMLEWSHAMSETWHGQFPVEFFRNLEVLGLDLSYIESAVFAAGFVQELYNLQGLILSGDLIKEICPYKGRFPTSLRWLRLVYMPKLMHLWKEDYQTGKAFQNLEELRVERCGGLKNLEPFPISLINLNILAIDRCDGLINLVTSSIAKTLVQLREMVISKCENIVEIVAHEGDDSEIVFSQLKSLKLEDLPRLTSFHPGNCTMKFLSLNEVTVRDCPEVKIFSQGVLRTPTLLTLEIEGHTHSFNPKNDDLNIHLKQYWESHTNEKVALHNLENMEIFDVDNLRMICHGQIVPNDFFGKLKVLTVKSCGSLKSLFPASVVKHLIQLGKLEISDCKALEDIVIKDEGLEIEPNKFVFPRLTSLELSNLPELKSFYPATHTLEWPFLKVLNIFRCTKVKILASDSTISVQNITIQQPLFWIEKDTFANLEHLKMLEWSHAMSETWHGQFPVEFFRKLKVLGLDFSYGESAVFAAGFVKELYNLEALLLTGELIKEICPNKGGFPTSLRRLQLFNMPELKHLWKEDSQTGKAFQNLRALWVERCGGLKNLEPFPISLRNLNTLAIDGCDGLINLVTSSIAKTLVQLRDMVISKCENIVEIVAHEGDDSEIVFSQLKSLKLEDLPRLTSFHPGNCTMKFLSLNEVTVRDCPEVKIFSQGVLRTPTLLTLEIEGHTHSFNPKNDDLNIHLKQYWESHTNEKVALHNLENMEIFDVDNLRMICHGQIVPNDFFGKLKVLTVKSCGSLKSLFPTSVVKHLIQLGKLEISDCKALEDIVIKDGGLEIEPNKFVFPRLTSLELSNLPELKSFYPATHTLEWPFLKVLNIFRCTKVKIFATNSTISVQNITIQQPLFWIEKDTFANLEHLKTLEWSHAMSETWHGQFPVEFFRKLKVLGLDFSYSESAVFDAGFVKELYNLEALLLTGELIKEICPNKGGFPTSLRRLQLFSMPELKHLWKEDSQIGKTFQNLEVLRVERCGGLKNLEPFPIISLQNLKSLIVWQCDGLINLVTSSVAKTLVQLRVMNISKCEKIVEIVAHEGDDFEIVFCQLKSLKFEDLPSLTSFHLGNCTMKFPSLNEVIVKDCPEVKIFSQGVLRTPMLSALEIEGHTHSFNPENDDLNIHLKQYWESHTNQKVVLHNLNMDILDVDNLRMIYHDQIVPNDFFGKLKVLTICCGSLKSLFPASVVKHLIQLGKLEISNCKALEDIVIKDGGLEIEPNKFVFPRLTSLQLSNLPELKSFYPAKHTLEWPSLEVLFIYNCNKVKIFASDSAIPVPNNTIQQPLFCIEKDTFANLEHLKMLEWSHAMSETWHGQFPVEFFRKLKVLHISYSESVVFAVGFVQELYNLEGLILTGDFIEEICPYKGRFPASLNCLGLVNMPKLMHLWKEDSQTGKAFQNLLRLNIVACCGLKNLEPFPIISLQNLIDLRVWECDGLIDLVTSSVAKTMVQLRVMKISKCKNIAEIVAHERDDFEIVFSQLKSLKLEDLPRLTSFHPGNCTMKFPSLNEVIVRDCPEVKIFSQGVLKTPMLSALRMEGHTHSFNPENDDLNIHLKQYWESLTNRKVDTSKEEDEEHNMDDDSKLEDTEEQAKNNTSNYEEDDKGDDSESKDSKLEESKEQVENNTSNC